MSDPTIALVKPLPHPRRPYQGDDEHHLDEAINVGKRSLKDIPIRYAEAVVTVPEIVAYVRSLVEGSRERHDMIGSAIVRGRSLLLVGATGTGKSYQAYGAIRALAVSGARCSWVFTSAADLYAQLRPRPHVDSEQEFEKYTRASFLVLDDLGAAKGSEWTEEINYRLINHRYEREKPTLITSNVPPKQLATAVGERVASRLAEMCDRVVLSGPDRRRTA
jgi:DNA replication protein DnaC